MDPVSKYLEMHEAKFLDDLATFVAIPSVSTEPKHSADLYHAAEWVAARLRVAGPIEVEILETARHPAVLGRWDGAPGAPTVLVYGHFDVQPPEPLDAWDSPPFLLTERDGKLYGRGVSDDKASMLLPILAAEAFFRSDEPPPVNLRFLFEGEEEIGSPSLAGVVAEYRDALACDLVVSADGGMWRAERPCLTVSSRGLSGLELTLRGAAKDLHSGRHGGGVANPLHALAALVASLHSNDSQTEGRVAVAGFYDDVAEPSEAMQATLERLPFEDVGYLEAVGAPETYGEAGFSTLARQWYRPTLEVNGLWGGYQGPGSKTVIPAEAHAKITCRLVPNQDPADILQKVKHHLATHLPPGVTLHMHDREQGASPYHIPLEHDALKIAADTLAEVFNVTPAEVDIVGMGGSIPICTVFKEVLNADTLFFSFSVGDENIHAPNEFYRLERFRLGLQAWAGLWRRLGATHKPEEKHDRH